MKAIVNTGPNRLELLDWTTPDPGPGMVRIRVLACGICATDLEMIAGWERTRFPAVPGHEWAGEIEAVGPGVDAALIGKRCVAENVLADGGEVGFEHAGGYGQFLLTDVRNLQLLPEDYPPYVAALIEPTAVSVRAMKRLDAKDKGAALIFGDGPIGLLMTALMRKDGFGKICLVGGRSHRLALAQELGAAKVLNYHEAGKTLGEAIKDTFGVSFANIIEASGNASALATSMDIAPVGARLLLVGDYGQGHADFLWNRVLHKELQLIGSNASAEAWPEAVAFASANKSMLQKLVSLRLPAVQFEDGIHAVRTDRNLVKAIMEW